jgi:hypothetical protein
VPNQVQGPRKWLVRGAYACQSFKDRKRKERKISTNQGKDVNHAHPGYP